MLEEYSKQLSQVISSHPVDHDAFADWKRNPITITLFAEFKDAWLAEANTVSSVERMTAVTEFCDNLLNWTPLFPEEVDSDV